MHEQLLEEGSGLVYHNNYGCIFQESMYFWNKLSEQAKNEEIKFNKLNNTEGMNTPEELKYTEDHEWVKVEGNIATVGITDFAQKELGDIVYVEIETEGEKIEANESFGTVEAVKTVSELFIPLTGEIVKVNEALESEPEKVNSDPYGEGWMIKIEMDDPGAVEDLMSAESYKAHIGA